MTEFEYDGIKFSKKGILQMAESIKRMIEDEISEKKILHLQYIIDTIEKAIANNDIGSLENLCKEIDSMIYEYEERRKRWYPKFLKLTEIIIEYIKGGGKE